ncbi:peptidase S8/S53 domain-containing protein [Chytridium lagenaria]|nr:peptidase S8/S53 domain-containing protein [Chytridium lagenaria]
MSRGHDINVIPVWRRGINGSGITVAIIDDGVEHNHPDFDSHKWSMESSYDFNERTNDPSPQSPTDVHGTRCAGEIGAQPNDICGVGVAYGVRLAGERLISESTTDAVEAQALNYKNHINDIYSSSWGPDDDGASLDGPGYLGRNALIAGVERGRGGRGSIFVFASGNGGLEGDNCNFDGYANSIYTVAIGAINSAGKMPPYGEICAAHLGVTYSGGGGFGIWTTDIGAKCTGSHSGTSAAAPIASGIIALMLSARPELRWRDVQQLVVETAQSTDDDDSDWIFNGAGRAVSHKYGFGRLNADLIVKAAEAHYILPPLQFSFSKSRHPNVQIPISNPILNPIWRIPTKNTKHSSQSVKYHTLFKNGKSSNTEREDNVLWADDSIDITPDDISGVDLKSLEHVQVVVRIRHLRRKHLTVVLDNSTEGFNPWTFMTVRNWGEAPFGVWRLLIHDSGQSSDDIRNDALLKPGELLSWTLTLRGTCSIEDRLINEKEKTSQCVSTTRKVIWPFTSWVFAGFTAAFLGLFSVTLMIWLWLGRSFRRRRPIWKFLTRTAYFACGEGFGYIPCFGSEESSSCRRMFEPDAVDKLWGDIESPSAETSFPERLHLKSDKPSNSQTLRKNPPIFNCQSSGSSDSSWRETGRKSNNGLQRTLSRSTSFESMQRQHRVASRISLSMSSNRDLASDIEVRGRNHLTIADSHENNTSAIFAKESETQQYPGFNSKGYPNAEEREKDIVLNGSRSAVPIVKSASPYPRKRTWSNQSPQLSRISRNSAGVGSPGRTLIRTSSLQNIKKGEDLQQSEI